MKATWVDRAIDSIARARAPKDPPAPVGPDVRDDPELERPSCPLCRATRGKVLLVSEDTWVLGGADAPSTRSAFAVVRCEVCTARYTSPRFRKSGRKLAYTARYPFYLRAAAAREAAGCDATLSTHDRAFVREAEGCGEARGGDEIGAARRAFEGRASRVSKIEPRPGRLLDVGCGDGVFLDVMRGRGWEVVGADMEEVVVWYARQRLGLECHVLDAESDRLPEGPFDVVSMWGLLQLVYEPQRLLERVREVLAPNGLLAIGVSNIGGAGARLFQGRWRGLGLPRHLVHFTPETLSRLVEWSGFEVEDIAFETPRWIIAGSVDALIPKMSPPAKATKAVLYALGAAVGRTRFADTMELYARRSGARRSRAVCG